MEREVFSVLGPVGIDEKLSRQVAQRLHEVEDEMGRFGGIQYHRFQHFAATAAKPMSYKDLLASEMMNMWKSYWGIALQSNSRSTKDDRDQCTKGEDGGECTDHQNRRNDKTIKHQEKSLSYIALL